MVEQYTENQYDDDLTAGNGEYDDSYYTGAEDLFDYTPDDESPISRLKSLVLSIDWEITDDVLMEFNEELVDLKDVWAGEKINLVYVQALEKLSKYIYQKKAESHPSAIKLLLTLYHNLEKIVLSDDLSDTEKKAILLEDVKRFENLKSHLKTPVASKTEVQSQPVAQEHITADTRSAENELLNLKAIVLGIDWEITDDDLSALRQEVVRLEKLFAGSRPRLILLQGIGTIGAYIKVKKGDSHADAFKVLHLFYDSLEKIVDTPMSGEKEKAILFPAVKRFNAFKALLGETISPASISRSEQMSEGEGAGGLSGAVPPAFSDLDEDEVIGFQADKEAAALGLDDPDKVNDHVASFFGEDSFVDERESTDTTERRFAGTVPGEPEESDKSIALQGVDVEEGEEDNDAAPPAADFQNDKVEVVPVLSVDADSICKSPEADFPSDADDNAPVATPDFAPGGDEPPVEITFLDDGEDDTVADFSTVDRNLALQGVDVESEADDDSDEDALPLHEGELAPALADNDEVSIYNAESLEKIEAPEGLDEEVIGTVLDFFEEEEAEVEEVSKGRLASTELSLEPDEDVKEPDAWVEDTLSAEPESALEEDLVAGYEEIVPTGPAASNTTEAIDEVDQDLSSDIEGRLNDFFRGDDSVDGMFPSSGFSEETASGTGEIFANSDEEEVVFELVEEAIESNGEAAAAGAADVSRLAGDVYADAASERDDGLFKDTGETETNDGKSSASVEGYLLDNIGICIEAAGLELEDSVLSGLLDEINAAEMAWSDKPLEKTFLHLLRTLGRHIDRYRYEAGSTAYKLLRSVFDALVLSQTAVDQSQDLLLAQTVRVLDWQHDVIARNSAKGADIPGNSESLFAQQPEDSADEVSAFEDELQGDVDNGSADTSNPEKEQPQTAENVNDEISHLRENLQGAMSALKKKIKGD